MSLEKELQHRTIEYAILAPLIEPWRGFERVITRYFSSKSCKDIKLDNYLLLRYISNVGFNRVSIGQ